MKIRHILPNDRPETIAKYQALLLEANPDCTIEGININPLQKNDQREGEFEVDFIFSLVEEKQLEAQVREATKQYDDLLKAKDAELETLKPKKNNDISKPDSK